MYKKFSLISLFCAVFFLASCSEEWLNSTAYTVVFDPNGGTSVAVQAQTFIKGESQRLKANVYTRDDCTFTGWNTLKNGTGTDYSDQESVVDLSTTNGDIVYLYAQWTSPTAYTIVFNANGGKGSMDNQSCPVNKDQQLTANAFTREGYTFSAWNTNASGTGTSYTDGATVKNISTAGTRITLYAQWIRDTDGIVITSDTYQSVFADIPTNNTSYTIRYSGSVPSDFDWSAVSVLLENLPAGSVTLDLTGATKLTTISGFSGCEALASVKFPSTLTKIGDSAFENCNNLKIALLKTGVTNIGAKAFNGCTSLPSITLPSTVTSIGDYAFYGCSALSYITFQGTSTKWYKITKGTSWYTNSSLEIINCTNTDIEL